ncbi:hypothetical protein D9758_002873 [Tetrapyrgos nigripes]|uniref:PX-domain-containing protein n=1 Tax=Tetrapyrgos nigripes TaxID=182062 RepID=A0A8H5GQB7_9AGAR|nr:hypothetical protein D9758_002873 [Tetrapyrgos nigripes]
MATLPRATKSPSGSSFLSFSRPQSSGFDTGINTSNAWTQFRHLSQSVSEDELARGKEMVAEIEADSASVDENNSDSSKEQEDTPPRPARALYDFEGKTEFQELTVVAGEEILVLKEDLADGWSLVKNSTGEIGLLPREYYTFTSEFAVSADIDITPSASRITVRREPSSPNSTPRNSTHSLVSPLNPQPPAHPIFPQKTGDWIFPSRSFKQSLLGGKSINRFSNFVTSGAEAWVLKGSGEASPTEVRGLGRGLGKDISEAKDSAGGKGTHQRYPTLHTIPSDDAGEEAEEEAEKSEGSSSESDSHDTGLPESDKHFVDAGHSWKSKLPSFRVLVHSPSKRASILTGAYTVYNVTSLFEAPSQDDGGDDDDLGTDDPGSSSSTRITVQRRYSHFVLMHTALTRRLPGIALPPLPEKQYAGRFNQDFVEARRGDLERYIDRVVRHPVARYAEVVTWFLSCESESEWKRLAPFYLAQPPAGSSFYAHVFHPAFNLDLEDAEEAVERFAVHTKTLGRGVEALRGHFGKIREARVEMSKADRLLSYSLFSLITSQPLASGGQFSGIAEEEEDEDEDHYPNNVNGTVQGYSTKKHKGKGTTNKDGAWCWREGCEECLILTKTIQRTADSLQSVADMYDDHARRTQLATHESLKGVAHPATVYDGVITTHRSTLTRYRDIDAGVDARDAEMAARCETVLNTTMAEMETYHAQKLEDFSLLTKEHLDGEIQLYEQILLRLRSARKAFDPPTEPTESPVSSTSPGPSLRHDSISTTNPLPPGPRQPSIYERELENPRLGADPLPQPTPHVFDSTPIRGVSSVVGRPVSVAVGSLLGTGGTSGRGSVFGNLFW